jgi:hypothetical protein
MIRITKQFDTIRQAERYLEKLYGIYSYARLVACPLWSESGAYIFEVNKQ